MASKQSQQERLPVLSVLGLWPDWVECPEWSRDPENMSKKICGTQKEF